MSTSKARQIPLTEVWYKICVYDKKCVMAMLCCKQVCQNCLQLSLGIFM